MHRCDGKDSRHLRPSLLTFLLVYVLLTGTCLTVYDDLHVCRK